MSKHSKSFNWSAFFVGVGILATSVAVFHTLGKPQYIHPVGILGGIIASVLFVQNRKYGKQLWFWLSTATVTALHIPLVIYIAESGKEIPAGLAVPFGIVDGVMIIFFNVVLSFWMSGRKVFR